MTRTRYLPAIAGIVVASLLFGAADAAVNKSIRIDDDSQISGQSTVNGSITLGNNVIVDGSVQTVNGAIRIGDGSRVDTAQTVNGAVRIGDGLTATGIESVNGGIRVGQDARISGDVSVVNGKVEIGRGGDVNGDVSNVNGEISIEGSRVGGSLTTTTGDVLLTDQSTLEGDLVVKAPRGFNWRRRQPPRVVIGPGSRVLGTIVAEHDIELFISDSAEVNGVRGEISLDDAVRFSGDRP